MNIKTYGSDERLEFCREFLLRSDMDFGFSISLLPIPSSRDGINFSPLGESEEEFYSSLNKGDAVVGYSLPEERSDFLRGCGALVLDLKNDEELLQYNAALTADAALGKILTMERRAPRDLSIGIIGCGRIGYRLLGSLMLLGSDVSVFTTRREVEAEICALGARGVPASLLSSECGSTVLSEIDILINTAPSRLISPSLSSVLSGKTVIELASGDNIPKEIEYLRWGSLPGKCYPISAGYALGRAVLRALSEQTTFERN